MRFRIEKNIPIPAVQKNSQNSYPFPEMEIGDSFIINDHYSRPEMSAAYAASNSWNKKCNEGKWKFVVRKTKEGKIRIWRTR